MTDEPRAITVSRDALRADLAEMELRLRVYFDEQLKHKADIATVVEHGLKIDNWSKGEFTPAMNRAIEELVGEMLTSRTDRGWSMRERWFGMAMIMVTILSFTLALVLAGHQWGG